MRLFCPLCGQEMANQPELYGRYTFHDTYYGCKKCDHHWKIKERSCQGHFTLKSQGSLSQALDQVREKEQIKEQRRLAQQEKDDAGKGTD